MIRLLHQASAAQRQPSQLPSILSRTGTPLPLPSLGPPPTPGCT